MGDQLDRLFEEWCGLAGAVLLADEGGIMPVRTSQEVIAESTACRREVG